MNTFRWALLALVAGCGLILTAYLWPAVDDPRARWTNEKSANYSRANSDIHGLLHSLSGDSHHAHDPSHVHTATELADPLLGALELERAREQSTALRADLEAAREIPPGWHLLLGLAGGVLVVVGGLSAVGCWLSARKALVVQ